MEVETPDSGPKRPPMSCFRRCCCRTRTLLLGPPPPRPTESVLDAPAEVVRRLAEQWSGLEPPRVCDVWQQEGVGGRARLLCGGLCVTGPAFIDRRFTICAWSSILA